jgi:high-affinity iron transporter
MSTIAYHAGDALGSDRWYAALLSGMFNITPEPTWLEIAAWIAYGVPVLVLFLGRKPAPATAKPIPAPAP